ncbi:GTPase [Cetobacterium sp.]|uniref:GTPase n=1 Tax=Cetobacterium sp. TaxID=2071632 RepID=UPI003EE5FCBE
MEFNFKVLNDKVMKIEEELFKSLDDNSQIPVELLSDFKNIILEKRKEEQLKVAFCGQYSAGKSTMISALTGLKNIKIGQGITTEDVTEYDFNGFSIVDTPGIKAGREDHDKKSLEYIKKADLLVYVITADGFNDTIINNFKKMAFEENYINKMMLVINKKSLESDENEKNWLKDLENNFDKEVYEKLKVSVIDTETYLESLEETDIEINEMLLDYSNFDNFKLNLNNYVTENGLHGKIISRINIIQSFMNKFSAKLSEEFEIESLKEKIKFLKDTKSNINKFFDNVVLEMKKDIISIKNDFKSTVYLENINNFESDTKEVELTLENYLVNLNKKIEDYSKDIVEEANKRIDEIQNDYTEKIEFINLKIKNNLKNYEIVKNTVGGASKVCEGFWLQSTKFTKTDLNMVAKVLKIKFKPWGKVKFLNKIKDLGKGIAIFGVALECYNQYQDSEVNSNIIKMKNEIEDEFNNIIDNIKNDILNVLNSKDSFMSEIKETINNFENEKKNLVELNKQNKGYLEIIDKINIRCDEILNTLD